MDQDTEAYDNEMDLADISVKVKRVVFNGVTRTKQDILRQVVNDLYAVKNFEEMVAESVKVNRKLRDLGIFENVSRPIIDVDKSSPNGYEIKFKVKEFHRISGYIGTEIGSNEGAVKVTGGMRNAFGRAEKVRLSVTKGSLHTGFNAELIKPRFANPNAYALLGSSQNRLDRGWNGYHELQRALSTELRMATPAGLHVLNWTGMWRQVSALSNSTAMASREQFGHSVKSAIKHEWSRDERDHDIFPTQGYLLNSQIELAGLGGDAKYIKNDVTLQLNKTLFSDIVLQLSLAGGCMRTLEDGIAIHLSDRFYMGDPLKMRGFKHFACGPRSGECSLGGSAYMFSGLHLYSPLPFRGGARRTWWSEKFRLHGWVNAGNLFDMPRSNIDWRKLADDVRTGMRVTYGAGLAVNLFQFMRIELNYCIPLRVQASDGIVTTGWQWGFGLEFL